MEAAYWRLTNYAFVVELFSEPMLPWQCVFTGESGRKQNLSSEVLMGDKGDTGLGENPAEQEETQTCVFLLLPRPKAIWVCQVLWTMSKLELVPKAFSTQCQEITIVPLVTPGVRLTCNFPPRRNKNSRNKKQEQTKSNLTFWICQYPPN